MSGSSFLEFLDAYGEAFPPRMRYQPGGDFFAWRDGFLEALRGLLGAGLPRVAPTVQVLSHVELVDHVRHEVHIAVNELVGLPAFVLVPRDLSAGETRPGVLALHGHIRHGAETVAGLDNEEVANMPFRACGRDAVQAGYVVMAPAFWGWPGRDGHVERVPKNRDKCNAIQMAAQMYGLSVLSLHMQDLAAAVDALIAWPQVDATRLGVIGNSTGGRMAMWAAALDERLKACVAAGCMNTFRERSLKLASCGIQYPPGLLGVGDVAEVFASLAPRPLMLQADPEDPILTRSDIDAIHASVQAAYRDAGAAARLSYTEHGQGHRLVWDQAAAFLTHHLGPGNASVAPS